MSSAFFDLAVVKDAFDVVWNRTWVFITNLDVEWVVESKCFQKCDPTRPPVGVKIDLDNPLFLQCIQWIKLIHKGIKAAT